MVAALREDPQVGVGRDDREAARQTAVGDGDARRSRDGDGARDPRDHLDGNARTLAGDRLLPASPQDVGVPALEADHSLASTGQVDQERIDLRLTHDVLATSLGGVDDLRVRVQVLQQPARSQRVDDDHVRLAQQLQTTGGDEVVAARASAHQGHPPLSGSGEGLREDLGHGRHRGRNGRRRRCRLRWSDLGDLCT